MAQRADALACPVRKRASLVLGLAAGASLVTASVAALAPWAYSASTSALRAEIGARIGELTGLRAVAQGDPVFVFLPRPHVSIDDVRFADSSGTLRIEAGHLEGYLAFAALLEGRVEVARVRLARPELFIDTDRPPMPPPSAIGHAAAAKSPTPHASATDEAKLGAVEIVDGTAHIVSGSHSDIRIDAINVTVDWLNRSAAAHVNGHVGWHGETAAIDAAFDNPVDFRRGEPAELTLRLAAPAGSASFDGLLESMPAPRLTGRLALSAPSARRLVALAGASDRLPAPFDDVALTCDATITDASAECSGLRLGFDGNEFEGTLALRASADRAILSGTLTTPLLSLRPFLARLPAAVGRDGQWSRARFDLATDRAADLDLHLSAGRVELGGFGFEDARLVLRSDEGGLELGVPSAKASSGSIAGRARFGVGDTAVDLQAETTFAGIALSAATRAASGAWRIAGAMTGVASVQTSGASMRELMRNLAGRAEIVLADGEFSGIDLDRALHRLEKRPLSLAGEMHRGATAFQTASFALAIGRGIAEVENGRLSSPFVDLVVGGSADLGERNLNLHASATPGGEVSSAAAHEATRLRFDVAGSFDDPRFLPDIRSLIRRSGAAAPLLRQSPEATNRQGSARDAVP